MRSHSAVGTLPSIGTLARAGWPQVRQLYAERGSRRDVVVAEAELGVTIVIAPWMLDPAVYAAMTLGPPIESFFAKLKHFRAIATRDDKTARNFLAAVTLAARAIWLDHASFVD